jgi:phosphatidylinositol kinase/protein kinase (PI-3  family)
MLVLCNEVSGVEGTFRVACESSLFIMRDFKESLIGLLKAFVEDPVTASFLHTRDARAMKKKALQVLARVQLKLTGRDFGPKQLQTSEQVHRLSRLCCVLPSTS